MGTRKKNILVALAYRVNLIENIRGIFVDEKYV